MKKIYDFILCGIIKKEFRGESIASFEDYGVEEVKQSIMAGTLIKVTRFK